MGTASWASNRSIAIGHPGAAAGHNGCTKELRSFLRDRPCRNTGVRFRGLVLLLFVATAVVRLGTGPVDGHYARFGEALCKEVAKQGIELELVTMTGSMENIRLLVDGEINVGLLHPACRQGRAVHRRRAVKMVSTARRFRRGPAVAA